MQQGCPGFYTPPRKDLYSEQYRRAAQKLKHNTMLLSSLPKEIKLPSGELLKPYVGHLKQKEVINTCKQLGKKYLKVKVLHSRLRGVKDLHGNQYKPTEWIFTNL